MSVFVLLRSWDYEGSTLYGVYTSLDKARDAADSMQERMEGKNGEWNGDDARAGVCALISWGDTWDIYEVDVDFPAKCVQW